MFNEPFRRRYIKYFFRISTRIAYQKGKKTKNNTHKYYNNNSNRSIEPTFGMAGKSYYKFRVLRK